MRWLRLIVILVLVPLAACSINPRPSPDETLVTTTGPYTIDGGDVLRVGVYGEDTLSKTYRVDGSGQISFPLAGPITLRGLTTNRAASAIAAALSSYMRHPDVTVEIDTYRPFYIQGGVATPGQFAFVPGMTVRAAVSTAGGFEAGAGPSRVTLYRTLAGRVVKDTVSLDFPIYPGDTIVVGSSVL